MDIGLKQKARLALRSLFIKGLRILHRIKISLIFYLCRDSLSLTRLLVSFSSITWAVALLIASYHVQPHPHYIVLTTIAPVFIWAFLFMVHGVSSFLALVLNVRSRAALILDGVLGVLLWTTATLSSMANTWPLHIHGWVNQALNYVPEAQLAGTMWLSVITWWHLFRLVVDYPICNIEWWSKE